LAKFGGAPMGALNGCVDGGITGAGGIAGGFFISKSPLSSWQGIGAAAVD